MFEIIISYQQALATKLKESTGSCQQAGKDCDRTRIVSTCLDAVQACQTYVVINLTIPILLIVFLRAFSHLNVLVSLDHALFLENPWPQG